LPKPFNGAMANRRQQAPKKPKLPATTDAMAEDLVIFRLGEESFGFRLSSVAEIIPPPDLAHMPLVPPALLGLANLRGVVLPVLSLRILLRMPEIVAGRMTRVIVTRGDAPVGFVVDEIDRLLALAADQLEDESAAGTIDPALLDGIIKGAEGKSPIKLLDPRRLLDGQFARLGLSSASAANPAARTSGRVLAARAETLVSLLSFCIDDQEYAVPLDGVREIIPLPDQLSELPRSETAILGVVTLRDRLLPLVSLRALLGLAPTEGERQRGKVVVMSIGESVVGVVVDATREILRLDPGIIDPAPSLLTRGEGDAEINSICRLEGGRRLVALLSPDRLFRSDIMRRILDEQEISPPAMQPETDIMAEEQFIIFRLGKQDYGIPIASVSEIARPPEYVTRLPKAPAFIDGVMNLRGSVVPIVDLRRRFDLSGMAEPGSCRILVVSISGVLAGFLVDSIAEIMKVPIDAICPAPELSPEQMRLISRVINLEASRRLILLIDPGQLLDQVESDVLAKFKLSTSDSSVPAS
jgi:purine-binding chemotaxis protein CheW